MMFVLRTNDAALPWCLPFGQMMLPRWGSCGVPSGRIENIMAGWGGIAALTGISFAGGFLGAHSVGLRPADWKSQIESVGSPVPGCPHTFDLLGCLV